MHERINAGTLTRAQKSICKLVDNKKKDSDK